MGFASKEDSTEFSAMAREVEIAGGRVGAVW